jgi:pyruvate formate lyase activating enzyme
MIIKGLQKLTLIDYPGQIACTIFTFGCNFRCPFCYNAGLVIDDSTPTIPEEEILNFLRERKGFLTGVCITGGEPTLHADLPQFIYRIKRMGYLVKLDTNGTNPRMVENLILRGLVDYVAMDIKAPWEKYNQIVKVEVDLDEIKKTFDLIVRSSIDHEIRTTVVPRIHTQADIVTIARQIKQAERYYLQQFQPIKTLDPQFMRLKPFDVEELEKMCKKCNRYLPTRLRM